MDFTTLQRIHAPFEPRLASDVDTTNFPVDDIAQLQSHVLLADGGGGGGGGGAGQHAHDAAEETPEMSLPFIGYTFKRFENNFH